MAFKTDGGEGAVASAEGGTGGGGADHVRHCCRPIRDIPPHSIVARHSSPVKAQPLTLSRRLKNINSLHTYVLQHDNLENAKVRKTATGRIITNDPPHWLVLDPLPRSLCASVSGAPLAMMIWCVSSIVDAS